jgi:hypothetical protein
MKNNLAFILISSVLIIAMSGCKKNELKKPTDVSFMMDINRSQSQQGHLTFTEGNLIVYNFTVEGKRKEGEDVSFSKNFAGGLNISFSPTDLITDLVFDIPQGNYTELDVIFSTQYSSSSKSLTVNGTYTNSFGTNFPLIYEFNGDDEISITSEDDDGEATIVLDKDISQNSVIQFDPVYWFGTVSNNLFDNASLVNISGQPTILVNSETNEDIYDLVVDRMEETTIAIW